ncbi:MAG: ABC transporter substrate-binding protein [Cyanobacteria bacterium P01_A01_bin.83]
MKPNLYSQRLLQSLEDFVQQMYVLQRADDPRLVAQLVIKWTKGQPLLTKSLLYLILESQVKIVRGQEAIAVERIVRNRLIKEFKQDNLTLPIRKLLYTKNLIRLLTETGGTISSDETTYLKNLQQELGLSKHQGNTIREEYLSSVTQVNSGNSLSVNSWSELNSEQHSLATKDSYDDLILLLKNLPTYDQSASTNTIVKSTNQKSNLVRWINLKNLGLLLLIPLLFSIIRQFNRQSDQITSVTNSLQTEAKCEGLNTIQSPRMSLGDKLLTDSQQYNNLDPSSKITLYQATAAFSNCQYDSAQNKFKQALSISKNNPEARIYLNNTQAITQENLKIAASVPLVSKPEVAWEILRGIAQAQTKVNQQGGIEGKQLLIQIVNDDNDPELVSQLAPQIVADQDILAVVGHNDSNTSLAASDIYQQQGLVMISPTSASTKLSGIGDYIMRTTPSVAVLANTLSSYAEVRSFNKIVVCTDSNSSASTSFAAEFIADMNRNGGEIARVECDLGQENFNPVTVIEQAISLRGDAILLAASVKKIDQAVSLAQANQGRLALLGSHSLYTHETIGTGKAAVAQMVLSVPWLPQTEVSTDFAADARQLWGGQVNWRTATSYDATQAIITGLQQATSRDELQSVLTNPNFIVEGATETFQFSKGDRLSQVQLAYIGKSNRDPDSYQFLHLEINSQN